MADVADEIEKLNELKTKGVLSAKEFEKQKRQLLSGKRKSKKFPLWLKLPLAGLAIFIGIFGLAGHHGSSDLDTNGLPKCDSALAATDAKNAIHNSPMGRTLGFDIVAIEKRRTTSKGANETACTGQVSLNNGDVEEWFYTFKKSENGDGTYMVTAGQE